jgi:hypothetical protein
MNVTNCFTLLLQARTKHPAPAFIVMWHEQSCNCLYESASFVLEVTWPWQEMFSIVSVYFYLT